MNPSQSRRCLAQSLLCLCHIPRSSESCSHHHQQLHINASAPDCIPILSAYERFLLCNHWQPYGLQPNTFLRCLLSRYGSPVQSIECPDGCGVKKKLHATDRPMTTPLFLLRCVQLGISSRDLDLLTIGMVNDMYAESSNDEYKGYAQIATQMDFDAF